MNEINMEIQSAISELNENIDTFIKENKKDIEQMKVKMFNENTLPLAKIDGCNGGYQKADFSNYIRNGIDDFFKKSLNSGTGEKGGYFLPGSIVEKVNSRMKFLSPMRSIAKVMTISSNSIDMLVDSKNPDAGWAGDAEEERAETDSPEIQKIKIPVHEIYAKPKANQRLLDDAQVDVEEWLIAKISEKIAILENDAFVKGNGSDKPKGFLNYDTVDNVEEIEIGKLQHFKTGADGKFTNDESAIDLLIDVICSIKPVYAKNAKWIMSRSALSCIRKLKNNDGIALWQPSIAEATPSMLLGYPVILDDDMPALKNGTKSASIAFGDFRSGYQIVDRQGLKILRDPYTSKPFVEFYASKRTGGAVIDFNAIKILKFEE